MQTYGRLPVAFVRGEGIAALGQRRQGVPGLPRRARGHVARPRPPGGRGGDRGPGEHAAARLEPVLQRRAAAAGASASTCCSPRRPARRAGCSSPTPAPRPTSARSSSPAATASSTAGPERFHVLSAYNSFHGRTLTTLAATGQPQKQETFQPLPDGLPPGRVRRPRRARAPRWTSGCPRSCSKRCRAKAGCSPRRRATSKRCAACATSARRC